MGPSRIQPLTRRGALLGAGSLAVLSAGSLRAASAAPHQPRPPKSGDGFQPVAPAITAYISGALKAEIPGDIRERARLHVLDTLASIIACHSLEAAMLGRKYASAMSGGGSSPILGSTQRASATDAVFATAMTAHAAEINDFIPSAYVQPGPAVVSAALEVARSEKRNGRDLVSAVVTGYELAGRIPKAVGTANLYRAGLANHGVAPTFASAAAVAPLLGLSAEQVDHMLSYCAQQASGSWQWLLDVRHIEKAFVFAGMGARNGLQAAIMAQLGFTGVPGSMDNPAGWFRWRAFQGEGANHASLVEGLGQRFELSLAAMKRYPVGGPAQPAVRALLALRQEVTPDQVTSIRVAMPGEAPTFERAAMPALNIPYLAAIIMLDGKLDFIAAQSMERLANDADAAAFARRVTVVRDQTQETGEGVDRTESARVTILRKDGSTLERYVPFVPGYPTHQLSREQTEGKARELVGPVLGAERTSRLISLCAGLDSAASVQPLVDLMRFDAA